MCYFLKLISFQSISFNYAVRVSSLQHKLLIKITLAESDLLDCSNSTISFKNFNLFNCLRRDFRDEIVSIKDKGLEKPSWSN
ncbi:hypothetical protein G4B88_007630 [Cannabis sativa]|uniref:Uncharacterized protein n=1 Tax=Cannabis sativa TaxID=3483 RepID=A0A7J6HEF5_CANSA|nr:hypothetical protein G4B88_007630 [Cannabis sativa]